MAEQKVKIYGADWCPTTTKALKYLDRNKIAFEYIDVEQDPAASQWVKDQNDGKEKKPTIDINGKILSEPSTAQLEEALKSAGLM